LKQAADYGHDTQTRNFALDAQPAPGWSADWQIDDRRKLRPAEADVHVRFTDLTTGAQAGTGEAWVTDGSYNVNSEVWVPLTMVRRQGETPLASTFVTVIEPYESASNIAGIRRLPLTTPEGASFPDSNVAVEVQLADGSSDLIVAADAENPLGLTPARSQHAVLVQPAWGLHLDGELAVVRRDKTGGVVSIVLCRAKSVRVGLITVELKADAEFIEIAFDHGRAAVVSGDPAAVRTIRLGNQDL
jgi:hypothetical protein